MRPMLPLPPPPLALLGASDGRVYPSLIHIER
jgi:hypothetical protein